MPDLKDIILGNVAVERGIVTREVLQDIQQQQQRAGLPLGQMMLKAGVINGSRLIELMKLVNVTIQHLDGGLEVGVDSTEEPVAPGVMGRGSASDAPAAPAAPAGDDIPVAPVVGGARPMTTPGRRVPDGATPATPAPLRSPIEQTPRPAPPPSRTGAAAGAGRPKTEAFQFDQVQTYKPKTEATPGPARPAAAQAPPAGTGKPATQRFSNPASTTSGKPGTQRFSNPASTTSGKPGTQRFSGPPAAQKAGGPPSASPKPGTRRFDDGRPKTETFDAQLVNDTPEVQGALGESVAAPKPPRKDKTRLYRNVDLPQETPAGKLPPEGSEEGPIALPPKGHESRPPGMARGAATPAGRLPSGIDAESGPLASPLDDSKVIKRPAGEFEMPPGAEKETAAAAPEAPKRQSRPEDSGFIAESELPDFEIRPGTKPGQKPVVIKNPKHPTGPVRPAEVKKSGIKRSGIRPPGEKDGTESSSAGASVAAAAKEEEPPKKKRRLWLWITFVILLLALVAPVAALLQMKRLTFQDLKDTQKVWVETQKLFEELVNRVKGPGEPAAPPAKSPGETPKK